MKVLLRAISTLMILVFLFSCFQLYRQYRKYRQIDDAHREIVQMVVQTICTEPEADITEPSTSRVTAETEQEQIAVPTEEQMNIFIPIEVDFEILRTINPDIVGWLYCEGTSINYPVLKGETNDTYLYHRYDGTYSAGGSIFMDYRCEGDFSDEYTVIYGHNMLADSMFNCLDYFREQGYLDRHSRMFYLTPSGENYCLEVICTNLTAYKDDLRLFELRDDERNLELIRSKAEADTGIEASNDDQLVLLATCTYDFKNARCTLLCKVIPIGS